MARRVYECRSSCVALQTHGPARMPRVRELEATVDDERVEMGHDGRAMLVDDRDAQFHDTTIGLRARRSDLQPFHDDVYNVSRVQGLVKADLVVACRAEDGDGFWQLV